MTFLRRAFRLQCVNVNGEFVNSETHTLLNKSIARPI